MNDSYQANERYLAFLEEAKSLRSTIDQLQKLKSLEEVSNKMGLLDYAQLNASIAYSLSSLLKMNMDLNGEPVEEERHEDEEKIKGYFTKIQEIILTENDQRDNPFAVSKTGAERIIKAGLYDQFQEEDEYSALAELHAEEKENKIQNEALTLTSPKKVEKEKAIEKKQQQQQQPTPNGKENKKKPQCKKGNKGKFGNENVPSWREQLDKMLQ